VIHYRCSILTAAASAAASPSCVHQGSPPWRPGAKSYRSPLSTHLELDHGFQGLPQRRGVGGVWLVFQRPQDTAGDGGDVGVAAPASGGELVRYLDDKAVLIGRRILRAQDELTGGIPHFGAVAQCRVLAFGSSWESLARGGVTMDKGGWATSSSTRPPQILASGCERHFLRPKHLSLRTKNQVTVQAGTGGM